MSDQQMLFAHRVFAFRQGLARGTSSVVDGQAAADQHGIDVLDQPRSDIVMPTAFEHLGAISRLIGNSMGVAGQNLLDRGDLGEDKVFERLDTGGGADGHVDNPSSVVDHGDTCPTCGAHRLSGDAK